MGAKEYNPAAPTHFSVSGGGGVPTGCPAARSARLRHRRCRHGGPPQDGPAVASATNVATQEILVVMFAVRDHCQPMIILEKPMTIAHKTTHVFSGCRALSEIAGAAWSVLCRSCAAFRALYAPIETELEEKQPRVLGLRRTQHFCIAFTAEWSLES